MLRQAWCAVFLLCCASIASAAPSPPGQPPTGPGGAEYRHREVVASSHGAGAAQYWLFEPAAPVPKAAPIVVFLHGWGGVNPDPYRAWIDHIVKRGNIVIYPRYQADLATPVRDFAPNAAAAARNALELLRADKTHVAPDVKRFALVGHSMGGILCANIAALAPQAGLPPAQAFMSVQPGKTRMIARRAAAVLEDLSQVPAPTLILTVAGDHDRLARDMDAKRIYHETTQVPARNKNFIVMTSDGYGSPPLEAHHFSPLARNGAPAPAVSQGRQIGQLRERMQERGAARGDVAPDPTRAVVRDEDELPDVGLATVTAADALDFFGYWKLFDALTDAAFYGKNREFALGNTPQQRFMGLWSDGRPVREMAVFDLP
ncbi:MAG: alpha/beta hydrolase fold domain-containing protein [Burkholderiales bacterium]